jgi:hypothetical protein
MPDHGHDNVCNDDHHHESLTFKIAAGNPGSRKFGEGGGG